jgi:hypothetical protein
MKLLFQYSVPKLYHPTKLLPQSKWLADYALIFNKKPPSSAEVYRLHLSRALSYLPSILYSGYWVMLGHFDPLHCLGATALTVTRPKYHTPHTQALLFRSVYHRHNFRSHQIQKMYIHKDGRNWLAVLYPNISEINKKV